MCPCKKLFQTADNFLKECSWVELTLIKFCLLSVGIIIGLFISKKIRKPVLTVAILVFIATYVPLMAKLLPIFIENFKE